MKQEEHREGEAEAEWEMREREGKYTAEDCDKNPRRKARLEQELALHIQSARQSTASTTHAVGVTFLLDFSLEKAGTLAWGMSC